jgi:hypothetical protein
MFLCERGRDGLSPAPPSEPHVRFSRIRLSETAGGLAAPGPVIDLVAVGDRTWVRVSTAGACPRIFCPHYHLVTEALELSRAGTLLCQAWGPCGELSSAVSVAEAVRAIEAAEAGIATEMAEAAAASPPADPGRQFRSEEASPHTAPAQVVPSGAGEALPPAGPRGQISVPQAPPHATKLHFLDDAGRCGDRWRHAGRGRRSHGAERQAERQCADGQKRYCCPSLEARLHLSCPRFK